MYLHSVTTKKDSTTWLASNLSVQSYKMDRCLNSFSELSLLGLSVESLAHTVHEIFDYIRFRKGKNCGRNLTRMAVSASPISSYAFPSL